MDEARVTVELVDGFGGAVGGVVVDDDEVELEVGLLREHRADGVADGADAVAHGDDDGRFVLEVAAVELDVFELRLQVAAHFFQVFGAGCFHLQLAVAVLRIHVVEDFLAAAAGVVLHFGVEVFVDVYQLAALRQLQAQVVEPGEAAVGLHTGGSFLQGVGAEQEHGAEVEVVAQRALLVVDDGGDGLLAVLQLVMVGVGHGGAAVFQDAHHALQGEHAQAEDGVLGVEQGVGGFGLCGDGFQALAAEGIGGGEEAAACGQGGGRFGAEEGDLSGLAGGLQAFNGLYDVTVSGVEEIAVNQFHDRYFLAVIHFLFLGLQQRDGTVCAADQHALAFQWNNGVDE